MTEFDARDAARFLARYAKGFGAGAFATPLAAELAAAQARNCVIDTTTAGWRTVAVIHEGHRAVRRTDWLGDTFVIGAGSHVTHVARDPGAPVPLRVLGADYVTAYADDHELNLQLAVQHELVAVQISAASEIKLCWGPPGQGRSYHPGDVLTVAHWDFDHVSASALAELDSVDGWYDDYPFYSDGSWGALSLRGFYPDDPTLGVKPSEMAKSWRFAHAADLARTCDWTVLAEQCPRLTTLAEVVAGALRPDRDPPDVLERVRLLRMEARPGGGHLARHTDITDKAAGTRPGQVIRIHVPLRTHPDVTMSCWALDGTESAYHLPVGTAWYLDARKPHAVTNASPVDRVHLTVDVFAGPDTRDLLAELAPPWTPTVPA